MTRTGTKPELAWLELFDAEADALAGVVSVALVLTVGTAGTGVVSVAASS
jgi:hypothetical protein